MTVETKLLLVEHSLGDVGLLRAGLRAVSSEKSAFDIDHVFCLTDALKILDNSVYDLMLLDISLPDSLGIGTVATVRNKQPALPIIVLTSLDDEELAIKSLRLGAQDYFIKGQVEPHTLARAIRYAVERKRVDLELEQQRVRQAVLHEVNSAITATLDFKEVLDLFLDKVQRLLPEFAITVRLFNAETGVLEPLACRGVDEETWKRPLPANISSGRVSATLEAREPVVIEDALADRRTHTADFIRQNGLVSHVGVPLFIKGEPLGVISFYTRQRRQFPAQEIRFLATLAGQAAVAIHNSQLYARLKKSNETLEEALEIKRVLIGVIAHELKTPLQVIMGSSSLLSAGVCGTLTPDQGQRVSAVERSADELLHLIDRTIAITRPGQGKSNLLSSEFSVSSLLAELRTEFAPEFCKKGLEFDIQKLPADFTLRSDRIKLKEVLRNLLENARKFTLTGKVEVAFASVDANGRVEFSVSDTGIGIDQKDLPKIFDLFYRAHCDSTKESTSTGLGLTIVKRLVASISGEIHVESEVGRGSTFHVYLPIV